MVSTVRALEDLLDSPAPYQAALVFSKVGGSCDKAAQGPNYQSGRSRVRTTSGVIVCMFSSPDPAGKEATSAARQGRLSSLGIGTGSEVPREGSPFLVGWQTDLITSGLDPVPN